MKKLLLRLVSIALVLLLLFAVAGCQKNAPVEPTGEKTLGKTTEKTSEKTSEKTTEQEAITTSSWEELISFDSLSTDVGLNEYVSNFQGIDCVITKNLDVVAGEALFSSFLNASSQNKPAQILGMSCYETSNLVHFYEIDYDGEFYTCTSFYSTDPHEKTVRQYRFLNSETEERNGGFFCSYVLTNKEDACWSDVMSATLSSGAVYQWAVESEFLGYFKQ